MSEYHVFMTAAGDLAILVEAESAVTAALVRADDIDRFVGKVLGAIPREQREGIRPIGPARQEVLSDA